MSHLLRSLWATKLDASRPTHDDLYMHGRARMLHCAATLIALLVACSRRERSSNSTAADAAATSSSAPTEAPFVRPSRPNGPPFVVPMNDAGTPATARNIDEAVELIDRGLSAECSETLGMLQASYAYVPTRDRMAAPVPQNDPDIVFEMLERSDLLRDARLTRDLERFGIFGPRRAEFLLNLVRRRLRKEERFIPADVARFRRDESKHCGEDAAILSTWTVLDRGALVVWRCPFGHFWTHSDDTNWQPATPAQLSILNAEVAARRECREPPIGCLVARGTLVDVSERE